MKNWKEIKRRLDPAARYFWAKDDPRSWRLVNAFTLKSAFGCEDRLTALRLTRTMIQAGFSVAKMEETW